MKKIKYLSKWISAVSILIVITQCESGFDDISRFNSNSTGTGGSMARFTIACDFLYLIDNQSLKAIDISNAMDPEFLLSIDIGYGIETIFPYKNNLFIGANDGMYIYNIDNCSNPAPTYSTKFVHVTSCDPVVATDSFAYVTLRSGGDCRIGTTNNELDIIDISNINAPYLLASHQMIEPYGLGIDEKTAFICQGDNGLFVYDVTDPLNLEEISVFPDIKAYDCIPDNGHLLLIGDDGFHQYNYIDLKDIKLISSLLIGS